MTPGRFAALLDARGPALDRWPEPDRASALRLLARSERCRAALADALAAEPPPEADPALEARLLAGLHRRMTRPPSAVRLRPALASSLGWSAVAACFAAGLWLGVAAPPAPPPSPDLLASVQLGPLALDDR